MCLIIATALFGCSIAENQDDTSNPAEAAQTEYTPATNRKVIIDTDTGADDASALILAAKAENIDILGVTVLVGNVDLEQSTKNALAALETAGCDAPVYKGSADTVDGTVKTAFSVFGTDGMGDADLIHPKKQAEDGDAVDFIIDTVKRNPNEVEIIAIGPATNIAKAIQKAPDEMKKVKRIWSMGTAAMHLPSRNLTSMPTRKHTNSCLIRDCRSLSSDSICAAAKQCGRIINLRNWKA